jgi:nuclear pore complex protein Nup160
VWRLDKCENVRIIDLEAPIEAGAQHIRIVPHPSPTRYSHLVVVYKPGAFVVYRATDTGELTLAGERETQSGVLCAFDVVRDHGYRIHALFDRGIVQHESVLMDDIFQFTTQVSSTPPDWSSTVIAGDDLDAAYFDNLLGSSPPDPALPDENYDISETFIRHLFYPGRFSPLTLATALADYTTMKGQGTLRQRYAQLVGANVQMEISPQTGAPEVERYRQDVKREWLKVWARARELDRQARWPIASAKWGDQAFIVTREGVSMSVVQDVAGAIERFSRQPSGASGYAPLPDHKSRSDLITIASAGTYLIDALDIADRPLEHLREEMQATMANGLQEPVEDFGQRMWADHVAPNVSEDDVDKLRRELSNCSDVEQAIADTLANLSDFDTGSAHVYYYGVGNSLVTSTIQAVISHRHRLAQAALLLSLFLLAEDEETSFELVNNALDTWHRYDILQWVAEQPADEAVQERKRKDEFDLSSLQVSSAEDGAYDTSLSLVHHLLASGLPATVRLPAMAASTWLADHDSPESFALAILQSGLPMLAGLYASRLPASAATMYIRGRAALAAGRVADVVEAFRQASTGVADGSLMLPAATDMFVYYRHVTLSCSKAECHPATLQFGQEALRINPDADKPLWVAVFLAAKKLGVWDQAYSVVAAVPNTQWQVLYMSNMKQN